MVRSIFCRRSANANALQCGKLLTSPRVCSLLLHEINGRLRSSHAAPMFLLSYRSNQTRQYRFIPRNSMVAISKNAEKNNVFRLWHHQFQLRNRHCQNDTPTIKLPPRMTINRAARLFRSNDSNNGNPILTSQKLSQHCHNLALFGENSLHLNAYAKLLPLDQILEQAHAADKRIQNGKSKGLLDGVPVTVKANMAVARWWEMPHSCSAILTRDGVCDDLNNGDASKEDNVENDSTVVYESDIAHKLLKDCGAVLIGITNMDEFGMGSLGTNNGLTNERKNHRNLEGTQLSSNPTYNPLPWMHRLSSLIQSEAKDFKILSGSDHDEYWVKLINASTSENPHGVGDEKLLRDLLSEVNNWTIGSDHADSSSGSLLISPGGSSSGAAATVAHGSSLLSLGTDTGGSLRLPSAWTSTVGFKPSYGTYSRYGVVSYASSLDTVGFIAGSSECASIAWGCLENTLEFSHGAESVGWDRQLCRDPTARIYHSSLAAGNNQHDANKGETTIGATDSDSGDDNNHRNHGDVPKQQTKTLTTSCQQLSHTKPLSNIRIGIPVAFSLEESPAFISAAWSKGAQFLHQAGGATLVTIPESTVSSQWVKLSCAAYYVIACAEASSNLSRYDGVRYGLELDATELPLDVESIIDHHPLQNMTTLEQRISATRVYGFGDEVQRRVLAGTAVLSSDRFHTHYEAAAVVRAKLAQSLDSTFRSISKRIDENDDTLQAVDVMLVPTALSFPCALNRNNGKLMNNIDATAAFANDVMTIPISLGGFPSVSVPLNLGENDFKIASHDGKEEMNFVKNIVGLQIFGAKGSEETVLKVAQFLDVGSNRSDH